MDESHLREAARARLKSLLERPAEELPLDEAAAWLSAEEQCLGEAEVAAMLGRLDRLAAGIHLREGAGDFEHLARISHHLFETHGLKGEVDGYDDPSTSLLDRVLQTGKGLPILLSVIYMEVARRLGIAIEGVGFPGHFLISPRDLTPRFFIDPFHKGSVLRHDVLEQRLAAMGAYVPEETLAAVSPHYIVMRMSYNLKGSWLRRDDLPGALRQVERILAIDPERAEEWRDRGLILMRLGREAEAHEDLDLYLQLRPAAADWAVIQAVLDKMTHA